MARKDARFYKKGKQIAGVSSQDGNSESDLEGPLSHSQSKQAVCCVHGSAGWLVRRPSHCSGRWDPHIMGGSLSVRDELWGPHKHLRAAGRWRCPEEALVQQPALRLELNPLSAWTSLSQQIRPKNNNNKTFLSSYRSQRDDAQINHFELLDERCSINPRSHQL